MHMIQYTNVPAAKCFSSVAENNEDDTAGAIARTVDAVVWASPFVIPRAFRLGAPSLMYMKIQPNPAPHGQSQDIPPTHGTTHPRS